MRLATPSSVLSVLNIQSSAGSLASAGAALDATLSTLEVKLDTRLVLLKQTDHFFFTDSARKRTLRLTNGFVSKVVVTLNAADQYAGGTALTAGTDYFLDAIRGVVTLLSSIGYANVSVSYTSGFDTSPSDTLMADNPPEPLVQAHAAIACSFLQLNPANVSRDKAKALGTASIDGYQQNALRGLEVYARPRGTVMWPSASVPN